MKKWRATRPKNNRARRRTSAQRHRKPIQKIIEENFPNIKLCV